MTRKFLFFKKKKSRKLLEEEIILRRQAELELKENEIKLIEQREELEQKNAQLERFAYVASHDLAEPLRKITIFSGMLLNGESENLSHDGKIYLTKIKDASNRMTLLMQNILAYSQLKDPNFESVDLNVLLHNVLADLELKIIETGAEIKIINPLPVIEGVPFQLHQVFSNIISNALKFHKKNETPVIEIYSDLLVGKNLRPETIASLQLNDKQLQEDYYIRIHIKDEGIGFDPKFSERIFEIFERLHGKQTYVGTGVGLAIVKKAVEIHKGFIWAEAQQDKGSQFHVVLPLRQRRILTESI